MAVAVLFIQEQCCRMSTDGCTRSAGAPGGTAVSTIEFDSASSQRFKIAREAKQRAQQIEIADDEDRKLVQADLAKGPWFGLS